MRSAATGSPFRAADLVRWSVKYGACFRIVDALRAAAARGDDVFTPYVNGDRFHILCPFGDEHSQLANERSCFVADGTDQGKGFAIACLHGHCRGRSRLDFMAKLLEAGTLRTDDLSTFSRPADLPIARTAS